MFNGLTRQLEKHDLSVHGRLFAIIGLLLAAQVFVAGIGHHSLTSQIEAQERLGLASQARYYEQDADMFHEGVRAHVMAAILYEGSQRAEVLKQLEADAETLRADLASLNRLALGPELEASLKKVQPLALRYTTEGVELARLAQRDPESARIRLVGFDELFEQMRVALDRQTELISGILDEANDRAERVAASSLASINWASLAVIVVASILALLLSRSIRSSLRKVSATAQQMADGDLDVRSTVTTHDELGETSDALNRMAGNLRDLIQRLRADAERDAFGTQLVEALEMSDTEPETHRVISRAMAAVSTDRPMELLLADSSRANLERAAEHPTRGAPGCSVESPFSCVAVRRGNPVTFENSEALNACPRLRDRPEGAVSAVCVPVSFMGRSLGVLHTTGPANQLPSLEQIKHLTTLGIQAGSRIGTVRAFERTQYQAATDELTGLANRRTLEEVARTLLSSKTPFSLVMIDLDHFKRLNDTFGHEGGDNALRLFSEALRHIFRDEDYPARWGGEEFAAIITGANAEQAGKVVERLRAHLAEVLLTTGNNPFTASYGIADTTMAHQFDQIVRVADDALYSAKEKGRDRYMIGDPARVKTHVPRRDSEQSAAIDIAAVARAV